MKNYQKLYYQRYYAQNENGEHLPVSRRECFAPGEEPTAANPFKQRWYYDPEGGYALRLARTRQGDVLGLTFTADNVKTVTFSIVNPKPSLSLSAVTAVAQNIITKNIFANIASDATIKNIFYREIADTALT
jgi:hypothetical protein